MNVACSSPSFSLETSGRSAGSVVAVQTRSSSPGQGPYTAAGHVDEGRGGGSGLQGGLNAPQQVIGLQQQQHLSWYPVEQLTDLRKVEGSVGPDLRVLPMTNTH